MREGQTYTHKGSEEKAEAERQKCKIEGKPYRLLRPRNTL